MMKIFDNITDIVKDDMMVRIRKEILMEKNALILRKETDDCVSDICTLIHDARKLSCTAVNGVMVRAYWLIGQRIVKEEQHGKEKAEYGESLLKNLSSKLTKEFGNGFSYANLRNMRQFYLTYAEDLICYTLCSKLSWSHNRLIMRVADSKARETIISHIERERQLFHKE